MWRKEINWIFISILSIISVNCLTSEEIEKVFLNEVNRSEIRQNLEFLTRNPHESGTINNNRLADHLFDLWKSFGFDSVEKVVYKVLLSYPDRNNPNTVKILNETKGVLFTSQHIEPFLRPEDEHPNVFPIYNSFSPKGTVEGDLVYANHAHPRDFKVLQELGVNLKGKILIARAGENNRGNKVSLAEENGAIGILLFNDPYLYAQDGEDPEKVYPNSRWLPGGGAQRGGIKPMDGDSQTPDYPSLQNVYRLPIENISLPKILCQPIGYDDANHLLNRLGGSSAPAGWYGNFKVGPGFVSGIKAKKIRLTVNNKLIYENITNVIGIIKGKIEPDRFILAGNHRDAWGFGAVDAASGTAQMIEVTRIFGNLLKRGWKPRRSIVFCSWDGEEHGLIGSHEWVEDHLLKLTQTAVAYLNTDICVSDDLFNPNASPHLAQFLVEVTKKIPSPADQSLSLYKTWHQDQIRHGVINATNEIKVKSLGGGSDHVPFFAYAGVSSINIRFDIDKLKYKRPFSSYPLYHTAYDTFYNFDNYIDPEYRRMATCGRLNLFLIYRLAQSKLLPYNITGYRESMVEAFQALQSEGIWNALIDGNLNLDAFKSSFQTFVEATKDWELKMKNFNCTDELATRAANDQLLQLDKSFLKPGGIPLQPTYRHLVFASSLHNMYKSSTFPGIRDLIYEIQSRPLKNDPRWLQLERHVSDIVVAFHTATNILRPVFII